MTDTVNEVLQDPVELAVRLVTIVERHLDEEDVRAVVCEVMGQRAGRRRLAQALQADPTVLQTGRPPAHTAWPSC